jgi:hypothetical protein
MAWWLWLIIGALTWQFVTLVTFLITREDSDTTAIAGGGIVLLTAWYVTRAIKWIFKCR